MLSIANSFYLHGGSPNLMKACLHIAFFCVYIELYMFCKLISLLLHIKGEDYATTKPLLFTFSGVSENCMCIGVIINSDDDVEYGMENFFANMELIPALDRVIIDPALVKIWIDADKGMFKQSSLHASMLNCLFIVLQQHTACIFFHSVCLSCLIRLLRTKQLYWIEL